MLPNGKLCTLPLQSDHGMHVIRTTTALVMSTNAHGFRYESQSTVARPMCEAISDARLRIRRDLTYDNIYCTLIDLEPDN